MTHLTRDVFPYIMEQGVAPDILSEIMVNNVREWFEHAANGNY